MPSQPNPFFRKIFHMQSTCFYLKILLSKHKIMIFIMCHFLVKAIAFFELGKAISFSILFIFRISAMRLSIFKSYFSLDLYTYN